MNVYSSRSLCYNFNNLARAVCSYYYSYINNASFEASKPQKVLFPSHIIFTLKYINVYLINKTFIIYFNDDFKILINFINIIFVLIYIRNLINVLLLITNGVALYWLLLFIDKLRRHKHTYRIIGIETSIHFRSCNWERRMTYKSVLLYRARSIKMFSLNYWFVNNNNRFLIIKYLIH